MNSKNIRNHLFNKVEDWAKSVSDPEIKDCILNDTIITGGAIVSLLMNEKPHDYDVYFRTEESLKKVAEYYVKKYIDKMPNDSEKPVPEVQRCYWSDDDVQGGRWVVLKDGDAHRDDERLRIFIRSEGALGDGFDNYAADDIQYRRNMAVISSAVKKAMKENGDKETKNAKYEPIFMTNNALSLSDDIQVVIRFYGEPEKIHETYDFVHCRSYYLKKTNKLVLPADALEAIINKELKYVGSKYPLCSIIRTRKFINRGWTINAGQYVKMVLQLQDMNLKNLHVFEEQLIGVDSTYFNDVIAMIEKARDTNKDVLNDTTYLLKLIDQVFDGDSQSDAIDYMEHSDAPKDDEEKDEWDALTT